MTDPHTRLHQLIVAKKADPAVSPPAPPATPEEDLPPLEEVDEDLEVDDPEVDEDPEVDDPDPDPEVDEDPEVDDPDPDPEVDDPIQLPDPPTTSLVRQTSEQKKKHVRRFRGISGSDPIVF